MNALDLVRQTLDTADVQYVLIGAVAAAERGHFRATLDIDFLTTDKRVLSPVFWNASPAVAVPIEIRQGDSDDPLAGVVRFKPARDRQIDIVVGRYKWQSALIGRSEVVDYKGMPTRIPSTSDLILLKLDAGGPRDIMDIHELLRAGDREVLISEVDARIVDLPSDVQARWRRLEDVHHRDTEHT